uniref:SAM domain-containing protein n=1 Tax=Ditylum brightwellii TaxID=49249 RepID=A0A7S4VX01_9STRA|mmetsp:Transcript_52371/g.78098  ORF Transcript_52371/g.78098 Transcript_52371/m.78098 type:complete len:216 (+) Transcript_52371:2-649(+)
MTVRRSTLRVFKGSGLDKKFNSTEKSTNKNKSSADTKEWTCEQVVHWAKNNPEIPDTVVEAFEQNDVNGMELFALCREDLKEMGIQRPGTLALVTNAIKDLRRKNPNHQVFIDHDPVPFGKIINQLRLKVMCRDNYQPLPLTSLRPADADLLLNTVTHFFPGKSAESIVELPVVESTIERPTSPRKRRGGAADSSKLCICIIEEGQQIHPSFASA